MLVIDLVRSEHRRLCSWWIYRAWEKDPGHLVFFFSWLVRRIRLILVLLLGELKEDLGVQNRT
jgi:hypothetical protein